MDTRRQGNFVETLYRSAARSFVISPQVIWSDARRGEPYRGVLAVHPRTEGSSR